MKFPKRQTIYCLKLNEPQTRELILDAVVDVGYSAATKNSSITCNIEFFQDGESLSAQCAILIEKDFENDFEFADRTPIKDIIAVYEKSNVNYAYLNIDSEILKCYIFRSLNWKIKGMPRKIPEVVSVKFIGQFGSDFRCLITLTDKEVSDSTLQKLDGVTAFGKDLNDLSVIKYVDENK